MNKKKKIILASTILTGLLITTSVVWANSTILPEWMMKADAQIEQQIREKVEKDTVLSKSEFNKDEPNEFIMKAKSQDQKDALIALQKDTSLGIGEWKRESMKIINELPPQSRRLKMDEVVNIIKGNKNVSSISEGLNKIAGAPDWEGGSGIHRQIYFLDDERKEAIYIINGENIIFVSKDEQGKQASKSLFSVDETVTPKPTKSP